MADRRPPTRTRKPGYATHAAPHVAGSETSAAAAQGIEPKRGTLRAHVLSWIRSAGPNGATRPELAEWIGMSQNTVRPRVCELLDAGLICESTQARGGCRVLVALEHVTLSTSEVPRAA